MRFEVFKRDSFTCQYCGRMAPDVVLEIDHINPVKKRGTNNILNLITSCFDCNRGKGERELTENQAIKKQQEQLKELSERREQLKLLLEWKKELESLLDEQVEQINKVFGKIKSGFSDIGKDECKKWIKKFGFNEVYESAKLSVEKYFIPGDKKSIDTVFFYVPKICDWRQKDQNDPSLKPKNYIKGILRNRIVIYDEGRLFRMLNDLIDPNDPYNQNYEFIKELACTCKNWSDFWYRIECTFGEDYY